jgi:hyperosmotically inducible periplasmic protein
MKQLNAIALGLAVAFGTAQFAGCASQPTSRSTGRYLDDAAITAKVKRALVGNPDVSALDVHVTTYRGVVQLSGFVDNASQVQKAEQLARSINGVKDVRNDVQVKPQS